MIEWLQSVVTGVTTSVTFAVIVWGWRRWTRPFEVYPLHYREGMEWPGLEMTPTSSEALTFTERLRFFFGKFPFK